MALAGPRNTPRLGEMRGVLTGPVKANTVIYKGALVAFDATGFIVPGAAATTLRVAGRADTGSEPKVDTTGEASGATKIKVDCGVFRWNNGTAADVITQADVGNNAYIIDDQTVGKTDGTAARSIAGKIIEVDSSGVYVNTGLLA